MLKFHDYFYKTFTFISYKFKKFPQEFLVSLHSLQFHWNFLILISQVTQNSSNFLENFFKIFTNFMNWTKNLHRIFYEFFKIFKVFMKFLQNSCKSPNKKEKDFPGRTFGRMNADLLSDFFLLFFFGEYGKTFNETISPKGVTTITNRGAWSHNQWTGHSTYRRQFLGHI